ncbi:MAG: ABC transporter ATP-binding protein [Anaerosacchariphilus sp.]
MYKHFLFSHSRTDYRRHRAGSLRKSSLGKTFLCEYPYQGSIHLGKEDLAEMDERTRLGNIGYLGHDPELFNDTIEQNVRMGDAGDAWEYLRLVCLDEEIRRMPDGIKTLVGNGGVRLSGGQAQRLALARTLCHKKPLLILDDPFSALDRDTERRIFENLRAYAADSVVLLISHRLYLFPEMAQVIWLNEGHAVVGTHEEVKRESTRVCTAYLYGSRNNSRTGGIKPCSMQKNITNLPSARLFYPPWPGTGSLPSASCSRSAALS